MTSLKEKISKFETITISHVQVLHGKGEMLPMDAEKKIDDAIFRARLTVKEHDLMAVIAKNGTKSEIQKGLAPVVRDICSLKEPSIKEKDVLPAPLYKKMSALYIA